MTRGGAGAKGFQEGRVFLLRIYSICRQAGRQGGWVGGSGGFVVLLCCLPQLDHHPFRDGGALGQGWDEGGGGYVM